VQDDAARRVTFGRMVATATGGPAALLALVLSALILAAGCGGTALMPTPNLYAFTPDNPFPDVPLCFRKNTVDVLYVTDRASESDLAQNPRYGYRRSRSLAFGVTTVQIGKDVSWDTLVATSRSAARPADLPMSTTEMPVETVECDGQIVDVPAIADTPEVAEVRRAAEERLKALVAERLALTPKKEVYVFVHGTGSNFEEPTYVLAGLWHFMGRCGVPVVYTWPAGGGNDYARGYAYDRESSESIVYHLKQFLSVLAACPGVEKVHILANSRGTYTVVTALRELNIQVRAAGGDTRKTLKLGCLVLATADIDMMAVLSRVEWFRSLTLASANIDTEVSSQRVGAERLMQVPEQMVLYVSATDLRLNMADVIFSGKDRLGQLDPSDMTAKQLEALRNLLEIQFIDVRLAGSVARSNNYFCDDPAVSSDLILLLRDNRRPGAPYGRPLTGEGGLLWRIDKNYPAPAKERTSERLATSRE
jgi:esterase/lipase superfamily enzyme